ncbi:MAG: DUF1178 family protein [Rhodospirillales bacterium]|nr:DUF1178 family protein [Rhodospirillales bacterium]
MIVFDLACASGHRFEAWFLSGASFDEQADAGALVCPLCGNTDVIKAPMAPRVARSARSRAKIGQAAEAEASAGEPGGGTAAAAASGPVPAPGDRLHVDADVVAKVLSRLRATIESTCEDVGPRFAEEARRIHFGETSERGIYGEASAEEAAALREDGIVCQVLPWWRRRDG